MRSELICDQNDLENKTPQKFNKLKSRCQKNNMNTKAN